MSKGIPPQYRRQQYPIAVDTRTAQAHNRGGGLEGGQAVLGKVGMWALVVFAGALLFGTAGFLGLLLYVGQVDTRLWHEDWDSASAWGAAVAVFLLSGFVGTMLTWALVRRVR